MSLITEVNRNSTSNDNIHKRTAGMLQKQQQQLRPTSPEATTTGADDLFFL
jgi:hypothetical protein